ncbi:MAG: EAL domain-containing protein, partial [Clostridia bacterium]|nr:EAL domain-containing protein [Clostridia bacterium]
QLTDENFPNFEIEGDKVEFEITESVLLDNFDRVNEKLSELRRKGVTISLDDFGTGFSSMARLRDLNIDILKIDKFFIDRIGRRDVDQRELISSDIISMAHKLGLKVVAEGVENQLQKDFLINNNCDIIQGYYYSKPLSEEAAIDFLKKSIKND